MAQLWPALYGPTLTNFVRPNCGHLSMAQLWQGLHGPLWLALNGPAMVNFVWPNCSQLLYDPTVASFAWSSVLWPLLYSPTVPSFVWPICG